MALSKKWLDTVNDGIHNPAWDAYDALIASEVGPCQCSVTAGGYNPRFVELAGTGYACVEPERIKAILWVESGGPKGNAWTTRPLQIGNKGDPAYDILKSGAENSNLIMSAGLHLEIKTKSINSPELNIRAGIAYLFTRMAKYEYRSVLDESDPRVYTTSVIPGDSLDKIARRVGTTVEVIGRMSGTVSPSVIRVGQKIQYRKAAMKNTIAGWRKWDFATIAARYNGGGDPAYAEKLEYVYGLFGKLIR